METVGCIIYLQEETHPRNWIHLSARVGLQDRGVEVHQAPVVVDPVAVVADPGVVERVVVALPQ
jgi:hypothetical protein